MAPKGQTGRDNDAVIGCLAFTVLIIMAVVAWIAVGAVVWMVWRWWRATYR